MTLILWILAGCLVSGLLSLIGGIALLFKTNWVTRFSTHLVSFAVGALLATAFLDLLPEALDHGAEAGIRLESLMLAAMVGIIGFSRLWAG